MRNHNFGYFVHEGLSNMFSHGFMSFAAIGITVACLVIMGTFTLVAVNADANLRELENSNELLAFVEDDCASEVASAIMSKIKSVPNVTEVAFISKEEATAAVEARHPDEEVFQDLDPEIFRDRYSIHIADLELISQTKTDLEAVPGVAWVRAEEGIAGGFITIRNIATAVCVALILILFVVSVFIISNTIKLTTFDRREEIAIMKMVGATNGFIRWPFVYEGFMIGLLGAVIAFFVQWALYEAVCKGVTSNDALQLLHLLEFSALWKPVAVAFAAAGIFVGVGGSLSAIRRFLIV